LSTCTGPVEPLGEQLVGVDADPGLVDVGGGEHDAASYDGRDRDPDRPGRVGERVAQLGHDLADGLRCGLRRGVDAVPLLEELTGVETHRRRLDPGAAEVDADRVLSHDTTLRHARKRCCCAIRQLFIGRAPFRRPLRA
jgi:hypothetical protein